MVNRQKLVVALAISAGVCTSIGLFIFYRHRRQIRSSKTFRPVSPITILPQLKNTIDHQTSSSENDYEDSESSGSLNGTPMPDGGVPLTPDQAAILTRLLYESNHDDEQMHRVLTSIANASTYRESQINLANADCITRLRELLLTTDNSTTKCKVLLALNNLALNDFAITQFSSIVPAVIELCRQNPPKSLIRSYGLNLLINMSVLEHLHGEYMTQIHSLSFLIESTFEQEDETLSMGKILVNLSKNRSNIENLLQLTGLELKKILNWFSIKNDPSLKCEEILQRYLVFYVNLGDYILLEFNQSGDTNNNHSWLNNPKPQRQNALYFEYFDHDKQNIAKSLLRPQHSSPSIVHKMKRLDQNFDLIRQYQLASSVISIDDDSTSTSDPSFASFHSLVSS